MTAAIYDPTRCELGEGPLWHPLRGQLFWFDIIGKRLLTRQGDATRHWQFDEHVSAAGWVDETALLIASETRLFRFDLETGHEDDVAELEADVSATRSNDGRADPWGGFWIGTMGKAAEPDLGAIYRYYRGELRQLQAPITIPNAICFSPDRTTAYFTDSPTRIVRHQPLDPQTGWPAGDAEPWLNLRAPDLVPDGAVTDVEGNLWIAHWGAGRVSAYGPDARLLRSVEVPGLHATCPAFGGSDLTTLYCTSAMEGIAAPIREEVPENGMTFAARGVAKGRAEPKVVL
ncbi:MAG: SMP-30/gluconolactonase/LRE family protein [Paracoccaceae bacterium]|nr:SMP-30/gluconolactonase/LRE family protein [Paracoccaceae bacterium]